MFRQRAVMGTREGRYGCTRGPIMGFESRAISAQVTKQIVTMFSKTCDNAKKKSVITPFKMRLYSFLALKRHFSVATPSLALKRRF